MKPRMILPLILTWVALGGIGASTAEAQEPGPMPTVQTPEPAATGMTAAPASGREPLGPPTLVQALRANCCETPCGQAVGCMTKDCQSWCFCPPNWYVEADFLYLWRSVPRLAVGTELGNPTRFRQSNGDQPSNELVILDSERRVSFSFGTRNAEFDDRPSFRIYVGKRIAEDVYLEGGYWWIATFEGEAELGSKSSFLGGNNLASKFSGSNGAVYVPQLYPFDLAQAMRVQQSSRFQSIEMNLKHQSVVDPRLPVTFVMGLRYVNVEEDFQFDALSDLLGPPTVGTYQSETSNHLIGFQVGGDAQWFINSWWSLLGRLRGGVYANYASQDSELRNGLDLDTFQPVNAQGSGDHVGFASVFEFGIHTELQLTSGLSVRVGYVGLFLSDMALAPKQVVFSTAPGAQNHLNHSGSIFYTGPSIGATLRW